MIDIVNLPLPFEPKVMQCVVNAAKTYQIPRIIVLAVIKSESSGRQNTVGVNKNGTKDFGAMQINTIWHNRLENQYAIENASYHIKKDVCYNIMVGSWILNNEIAKSLNAGKSFWNGVGNYNSHTPKYNIAYQRRVANSMQWLLRNTNWAGA